MSFCIIYSVVLENHSVLNSPRGEGSISSSRSVVSVVNQKIVIVTRTVTHARYHINLCLLGL